MSSLPEGRQRLVHFGSRMLVTVTLACLLGLTSVSGADEPGKSQQNYAQRLAVGVCGTCHGPHGNSAQPKFPRLAGQNSNYLAAQLRNFRDQKRGDPDAMSYMWGMAGQLSDQSIEDLANYYSTQHPIAQVQADATAIATGREIYLHGVQSKGVPACATCHGPDAHGVADFPRLAGQHSQYVLKQLNSFQSNMRNVAVMHGVAQGLQLAQMRAVAAYVESLQ